MSRRTVLALCLALVQATFPLIGSLNRTPSWVALARPLAWGQFAFLTLSFAALVQAFLGDDFSVLYVAQHGNTQLPLMYKISAVWGAHEGSLLLWVLILSGWTVAVSRLSRKLPLEVVARVLSVMGMVANLDEKELVERFGGELEVASKENEGSTFVARLPLNKD
mgnify:CR=1 FL=1